ncbi:four helix bundle protein [Spongiivirga sp. MCCC 1A20706]|uniref:four helix bundle protein n=1 Tax=Spongiivirga sp. MCCC 1A20706 TaxID=3160963 RepID=UPI0039776CCE
MANHNFKNLKIWQEGITLVDETYNLITHFPSLEKFNLTQQLIRCSVSIPSNIAEGTSKKTDRHFNKYLESSLGSAFEWGNPIDNCRKKKLHKQRTI